MNWRRPARTMFLGLFLGCSDGTSPDPDRVCSRPLLVTATQSVTPVVSWVGGCRVNQVVIHEDGPLYSLAWAAFFPIDSNPILSPVQYAVLPTGAHQLPDDPQPLRAGTTYIIDVNVSDTIADTLIFVGSDTITP
jgi:hypothetical protein